MSTERLKIGNDWDDILAEEMEKPYYRALEEFLDEEYASHTVFPPRDEIFTAFRYTPYDDVKVLLLGQDPYHEVGQAHGMAFSVQTGIKQPPSLVNIFKEIDSDLGITPPPTDNGCRLLGPSPVCCFSIRSLQLGNTRLIRTEEKDGTAN